MSRTVLSPVSLDTGDISYQVPPGWTIATLLPLLNTSAAPGLENWDPDRWTRHRLTDEKALPSPMLVTAFGHGRHSCPAQPFSLSAMTAAMTHLFGTLPDDAGLDDAPAAGFGADRWCGTGGWTVSARLRLRLRLHRPHQPARECGVVRQHGCIGVGGI